MTFPSLDHAVRFLADHISDPRQGLPEEVFLFASSITPMLNVDLLVRDAAGRVLLSWRDDAQCGRGWHMPGGIVRFQETLVERVRKTAVRELGCMVDFDPRPLEFAEFMEKGQRERGHFITFVYACSVPDDWSAADQPHEPGEAGYLEWHDVFPGNMIPVHHFYRKYFKYGR